MDKEHLREKLKEERLKGAILDRALQHPVVLEIMADCAYCIDAEASAMHDPEVSPYHGEHYLKEATRLRERAAQIRSEDPELWETQPALAVWFGSMPESNGKANWTAILHRRGEEPWMDGITIDRSEYKDRVRYEADRLRWLIGELEHRPDILAYDADLQEPYCRSDQIESEAQPGLSLAVAAQAQRADLVVPFEHDEDATLRKLGLHPRTPGDETR